MKITLTNAVGAGVMLIVIIATAAGIAQLGAKQTKPAAMRVATQPQQDEAAASEARKAALEEIRASRAAAQTQAPAAKPALPKGARCIGGVVFAEIDGELRNVAKC